MESGIVDGHVVDPSVDSKSTESNISDIEGFHCSSFPIRIAGEIKSFSTEGWVAPKISRRAEKFMLYILNAGKKALDDGGISEEVMNELGMPSYSYLYANDLVNVLKEKHSLGAYKSLVFYLEACEYKSIFDGILPKGLNIYATTASNAEESIWGTYCPREFPSPSSEYVACLGDSYSVAWMEDRFAIVPSISELKRVTLRP
ncbi:hypothetical protein C5167_036304 [Papaver somniferum]|uniref:Uncharacterized protein n=1 Tax=Papaver somniferum TaxID=3469 RepID=A0A4Y7I755_PAPSO|nr:hypothetical protein C5167_036304 [Papaver somniferum]